MRVAIVHYWLVKMRGGEKVLEQICRLFPDADIFTHVVDPNGISDVLKAHKIQQTFVGKLLGAKKHYAKYLPLMPRALEALDLTNYDLVISTEAGPAKGGITAPDAFHMCYVHSPMRYIWDLYWTYQKEAGLLGRLGMSLFAPSLRQWDMASAARVDHIAANSAFVQARIAKSWGRSSEVIHPPVNLSAFDADVPTLEADAPYLYAGELTQYKRPDLVIKACKALGRKLVVVGDGPALRDLKAQADRNVTFLGHLPHEDLRKTFASSRAMIFPGVEDFGITPVEVMASGRPVIAYGRGGLTETVTKDTGIFFHEQSVESLVAAIKEFEAGPSFEPAACQSRAQDFSESKFRRHFLESLSSNAPTRLKAALAQIDPDAV